MKTVENKTSLVSRAVRWTGRITCLATLGLLLLFVVGEGFNPGHLAPRDLLLAMFFPLGFALGLVLAWRWEGAGGIIALGSLGGFYAVHFGLHGVFPKGWAFGVFTLPALFFLLSWGLEKWEKVANVQRDALTP